MKTITTLFNMKKSILFLSLSAMLMIGCDIDESINISPNEITEEQLKTPAGIKGLFVGAQTMHGDFYSADRSRVGSIWAQQLTAPVGGQRAQASAWTTYNLTVDGPPNDMWLYGYKAVKVCDDILSITPSVQLSSSAATQNFIMGVAKIIKADIYGELAAYFGSIPIDLKSLTKEGYTPPQFATQTQAYERVQMLLDEALVLLAEDADIGLPEDLTFGGKAAGWRAVANSLKARYYLHVGNYTSALSSAANGVADKSGDWMALYSEGALEYSPWGWWSNDEANSIRATKPFIDLLKSEPNDSRLAEYFKPNANGDIIGYSETGSTAEQTFDSVSVINKYSGYGDFFPIMTANENLLIAAECKARGGDLTGAVTDVNVIRKAAGLTDFASNDAAAVLTEVLKQKHLSLFLEGQSYNDQRRTKTMADPQPDRNFRFIYPASERNANPNTPADADDLVRPLLQY